MTTRMKKADNYQSSILNEMLNEINPREYRKIEKRMLLANRIATGIKEKGWKKIDLARVLGKRPSEITKWLSGTHNFNIDTLFDIEEVLGVNLVSAEDKNSRQTITFTLSISQKHEPATSGFGKYLDENPSDRTLASTHISQSIIQKGNAHSKYLA